MATQQAFRCLYDATGGPGWDNSTGWFEEEDLSEWFGVSLLTDGSIRELCLCSNELKGELRPGIMSQLTMIRDIDLSRNALRGTRAPRYL